MKESSKVEVVLRNSKGFKPRDRASLLSMARAAARKPCDVRVSPRFVEIVFFGDVDGRALSRLEDMIGELLEVVEGEPVPKGPRVYEEVERYLEEGLYWRVHVAAEEAWHRGGGDEARALALIAGALAKAQEGSVDAAVRILSKARRAGGWGADYGCLEGAVRRIARGEPVNVAECLSGEWLRRVLEPLAGRQRMRGS